MKTLRTLFAVICLVLFAGLAIAQSGGPDYDAWKNTAARAEAAIEANRVVTPLLDVRVLEAETLELVDRPFAGHRQVVRTGKARADAIDQVVEVLHDLRLRESLLLDRGKLLRRDLGDQRGCRKGEKNEGSSEQHCSQR